MDKEIFVRKASGELEQFSAEKLRGSLKRSGADDGVIEEIIDEKWKELVKDIKKIIEWKSKVDEKVNRIEQKFDDLKNNFIYY